MKKVITILMALTVFLFGGMTVDAKTPKKKTKGSHSKVIGECSITAKNTSISSISLLTNGKAKTNNKCWSGEYEKKDGGKYYILSLCTSCGDGCTIYLLADNNVYYIDGGSEGYEIWDFIYYPEKSFIHVLIDTSMDETEWLEYNDYRNFTSLDIPLSKFDKIGTYKLIP